ncbi:3-dehydroquinate dehydratase [Butyrivibrio fibrisolvens 16/4]|nr:3-dehydroquinate dehydratase [Butyrivibrio fibrisolvens 16/4]
MNNCIDIRGVKIGEGIPKICVPIVGKTSGEILEAALALKEIKHDLVEWRVDFFENVLFPQLYQIFYINSEIFWMTLLFYSHSEQK